MDSLKPLKHHWTVSVHNLYSLLYNILGCWIEGTLNKPIDQYFMTIQGYDEVFEIKSFHGNEYIAYFLQNIHNKLQFYEP